MKGELIDRAVFDSLFGILGKRTQEEAATFIGTYLAALPSEITVIDSDDEDLIERLFWEFDDRRKKQGEERLTFKSKMRYFASHILRKQKREYIEGKSS